MNVRSALGLTVLLVSQFAGAESVFVPQASSVLKKRQAEVGVGGQFGYQSFELESSVGTTFKNRVWQIPFFARFGITESVESKLIIPVTVAVDSSEGLASSRNENKGLGNLQIGGKWTFLNKAMPVAAALDLDLPTSNSRNHPAPLGPRYSYQIQQGFNTHLQLISDAPLMAERLVGHMQLGYMNTGTYTRSNGRRFNPSDLMTFGASLDLKLDPMVEGLNLSAEMVGNSALNHSKTGSSTNGNDKGTVLEAGPSLRYQRGDVRTWTGFLVDAGKTIFRAYNYRVNFGVSLLWGGR